MLATSILAGDEKQRGSWEQLSGDIAKLFTYPVDAVEKQGPSMWVIAYFEHKHLPIDILDFF